MGISFSVFSNVQIIIFLAISKIENGESRNGERGTGNGERGISKIGNI